MKKLTFLILIFTLFCFTACTAENIDAETSVITTTPQPTIPYISATVDGTKYSYNELGSLFFSSDSMDHSISITNVDSVSIEFSLIFSEDTEVQSNDIIPGKYGYSFAVDANRVKNISFTSTNAPSAMCVFSNNETIVYIYDEYGFLFCVSNDELDGYYYILSDLNVSDNLIISHPCYLNFGEFVFNADSIYVDITQSGEFCIIGDKVNIGEFFANAPKCELTLPSNFSDVLENPGYYCRAKSVNSILLAQNTITIKSLEELDDLLDSNRYPYLLDYDTVNFCGNYTIENDIKFEKLVGVTLGADVVVNKPITVNSTASGTVYLNTPHGVTYDDPPVIYNAPNSNIVWENTQFTIYDISLSMNIARFNGYKISDYMLGGTGTGEIISVKLDKNKNDNITSSIEWTVDGNFITATIDCVLDPDLLGHAILDITVSDGSQYTINDEATVNDGSIDLLELLGCYITVTDTNGEIRRYMLITNYVPTYLPVVIIYTDDFQEITSTDEYVSATVAINADYVDGFTSLSSTSAQIRGRGHSTWLWDKKPYKIKFDSKVSVLGLAKNKSWVLLANYADKTLIRNYLALETAKFLTGMYYAPTQYPVDVFLNGEYIGVYSIGEQIQAKDGRVELIDNGTDVDTGYLLEVGGTSSEDTWDVTCFQTELMKYVKIHTPETDVLTVKQVAYIKDYVTKADEAIIAGEGYEEYIDIDALIDWFILHELSYNLDSSFRRSCYLYKDAGGKLTMGPAWDFDLAFGNFSRSPKDGAGWACLYDKNDYVWTNWMTYLLSDAKFMKKLDARWDEIKDDLKNFMFEKIDYMSSLVTPSAKYNFEVWNIMFEKVGYQPSYMAKYNTYEGQIQYLKDYIELRWEWMDANMFPVVD